jgi:segregation and condensation protein B
MKINVKKEITNMYVALPEKIIEAKEKGFINSRLEIIADNPPQWVLDELEKFFKDFKETIESEGY